MAGINDIISIPEDAPVWGELWLDVDGTVNFKFHTHYPFIRSKYAMKNFVKIIQDRIDAADKCPFHEKE